MPMAALALVNRLWMGTVVEERDAGGLELAVLRFDLDLD